MRTKNAKRLWPVPATLAVMALAVFLSFGLLATTGAQPAAAQDSADCTIDPPAASPGEPTLADGGPELMEDFDDQSFRCLVSGTQANIKLNGFAATAPNTTGEAGYYVYGTDVGEGGGSTGHYPRDTRYFAEEIAAADATATRGCEIRHYAVGGLVPVDSNAVRQPVAAKSYLGNDCEEVVPLMGRFIEVGAPGFGANSETLTLDGELNSKTLIHLHVGQPTVTTALTTITPVNGGTPPPDPATLRLNDDVLHVEVWFLGRPVKDVPDAAMPGMRIARSQLTVMAPTTTNEVPDSTDAITLMAQFQDANGDNLEGDIAYTVEYKDGSALLSGRDTYTSPPVKFSTADSKGTTHIVSGWAAKGPVVVDVSATFTGNTGTLTVILKDGLTRAGSLDHVTGDICFADADDDVKSDTCGDNSRSRSVYQAGDTFRIVNDPEDTLETTLNGLRRSPGLPDQRTEKGLAVIRGANEAEVREAVGAKSSAEDISDADLLSKLGQAATDTLDIGDWYTIDDETAPGMYNVTLKASQGAGSDKISKETILTITVSGEPTGYSINGPDNIALTSFSSGEYTVKAVDVNGNPPAFDEDESKVSVVVESELDVRVTGLDDDGKVTLNPETGEATFTVFKPAKAMRGDTASIGIFVGGELMDQITVMFGEAGVTMPEPGIELGKVSDVSTGPFNEGGLIQVNWASAPNATGYIIYAVNVDELDDPDGQIVVRAVNDAAAMTYNLDGLNVGANYDIYVVATAPAMAEWPEDADVLHDVTAN